MKTGLGNERLKSIYKKIANRYDLQHSLTTLWSDGRGRKIVVEKTVKANDNVLDCGAGTGLTAVLAADKISKSGNLTLFDLSEDMLNEAKDKFQNKNVKCKVNFKTGDMENLPFNDNTFDVVLSTYSLCPLYDPSKGALEMLRVTKPGCKIGIAHSSEPNNILTRYVADFVENIAWKFTWLSMGCRGVNVLPALSKAGGKLIFKKSIGVPLWPFIVFVVEK